MTLTGPGPQKVALARTHVRHVNPWSAIAVVASDVAALPPGQLAAVDCVISAVDNDRARLALDRRALAAHTPLVDAGVRADLFTGRVTVCAADAAAPSLACGWSRDRLARAGEDVGLPCAGIDDAPAYGSTLHMAQATAALAVHQVLALLGVTDEPTWPGHELRLDLHAGRLERFRRSCDPECAADHALAAREAVPVVVPPDAVSLGTLMAACDASADTVVVLAATELVASAACSACMARTRPYLPVPGALGPCHRCGAALAPVRRGRRVRWGEAAPAVCREAASAWFRPGDAFALVDGGRARAFAFAAPPLAWEAGRDWDLALAATRFSRLPGCYHLDRIRSLRLMLVGLGHLGASILEGLAPLPWAGLALVDRDRLEPSNAPAHALAAGVEEVRP